jgi:hypothetical protein
LVYRIGYVSAYVDVLCVTVYTTQQPACIIKPYLVYCATALSLSSLIVKDEMKICIKRKCRCLHFGCFFWGLSLFTAETPFLVQQNCHGLKREQFLFDHIDSYVVSAFWDQWKRIHQVPQLLSFPHKGLSTLFISQERKEKKKNLSRPSLLFLCWRKITWDRERWICLGICWHWLDWTSPNHHTTTGTHTKCRNCEERKGCFLFYWFTLRQDGLQLLSDILNTCTQRERAKLWVIHLMANMFPPEGKKNSFC